MAESVPNLTQTYNEKGDFMNTCIKRVFAFWVDWGITIFSFAPLLSILTILIHRFETNLLFGALLVIVIYSIFPMFVLRDVIFKGRSLGKRLFDLVVLEKKYASKASHQTMLFTKYFFIYISDRWRSTSRDRKNNR